MTTEIIETGETDHILPDGVYFDLDENVYHALHRMSATGIKEVDVSPGKYWARSWMNPDKKDKPATDAQRYGKAYHSAILEPELFAVNYCREITPADMGAGPSCKSDADMRNALKDMGETQAPKGESVMGRAERLKSLGYAFPIWHLFEQQWLALKGDRIALKPAEYDEVRYDQDVMLSIPEIAEMFEGGHSEVSVLWTDPETGVRFKARMDYLQIEGCNDLKTYANSMDKVTRRHLTEAFRFNRYYIQWVLYWQAYEMIRKGLPAAEGSTAEQVEFIEAIQLRAVPGYANFAFQEKAGIPNGYKAIPMIFQQYPRQDGAGALYYGDCEIKSSDLPDMRHSALFCKGAYDIKRALYWFKMYLNQYGDEGAKWLPLNPVFEITDADYPDFFLDDNGEQ